MNNLSYYPSVTMNGGVLDLRDYDQNPAGGGATAGLQPRRGRLSENQ